MNDILFPREGVQPAPWPLRTAAPEAPEVSAGVPVIIRYFRVAIRRKWLIIGAIAFAVVVGLLVTLLATPQYTAKTIIEISREGNRVVNVADVQPETTAVDSEFYQTQYGILASRTAAERVARQLRLADNTKFFEMMGADEEDTGSSSEVRQQRFARAVGILLDKVEISPVRLSRLVNIEWTSPNAELSSQITNAWAKSYIEYNLERRFETTSYARSFLENQLDQTRRRLEESERKLVGYASDQSIINLPVAGSGDSSSPTQERSLTADSLAALNAELASATADRIRAQSRVGQPAGGASAEALGNPAIASMRQRRAEVAAEYARLMTQFEPKYPPAEALAAQIIQLDEGIRREESRVQSSFGNTYQNALAREDALRSRVEGLKSNFLDLRRRSIQYNIFQRDVDTNRELYNGLLQRYKEIGVAAGVAENNVAIVDPAKVPSAPSSPRPLINMLIALLAGFTAGISLALLREQIDESVSDPADIERKLGLPVLGAIPLLHGEDPVIEINDPKSVLTEAYLSVQTSLGFSTDHGVPKTLTVTSTKPAEGKSTTSYALAHSLARRGARTLLVDGDMRSPSVHRLLSLHNERGLSNFLAGSAGVAELVQDPQDQPFQVLAAGPQPPNAADLLRGDRLAAFFAEASLLFDHIVVDAPPVMGLADAPIIASQVEGTVFVAEAGGAKARMARLAIGRLQQSRAVILGCVFTKFNSRRSHLGYGYDYGYGYEYGKREEPVA